MTNTLIPQSTSSSLCPTSAPCRRTRPSPPPHSGIPATTLTSERINSSLIKLPQQLFTSNGCIHLHVERMFVIAPCSVCSSTSSLLAQFVSLRDYYTERHRVVTLGGVRHLLHSVVDGGFLTTKPFIVRFLAEEERVDRSNEAEFGTCPWPSVLRLTVV